MKNVLPLWWGKFNQNKFTDFQLTYWPVNKLQVCKLVLIEFTQTRMAKHFSHHMSKTFRICKWISFAILNFISVEETPSGQIRTQRELRIPLGYLEQPEIP